MSKKLRIFVLCITGILFFSVYVKILKNVQNTSSEKVISTQENPKIALTFDDGPSIYTDKLLEGLKKRGVKASFFLLGSCIEGKESIVRKMHEEGHLIGNHTYEHIQLTKISEQEAVEKIEKTANLIYRITGVYTAFVRPPYGEWRTDLEFRVTMIPVLWDVDSLDWTTRDSCWIVQRVEKQVKDGDIILMHDCYESSVKAALWLVDDLMEQGYDFVRLDELIFD